MRAGRYVITMAWIVQVRVAGPLGLVALSSCASESRDDVGTATTDATTGATSAGSSAGASMGPPPPFGECMEDCNAVCLERWEFGEVECPEPPHAYCNDREADTYFCDCECLAEASSSSSSSDSSST